MKATIEFDLAGDADRRALDAALAAARQDSDDQPATQPDFRSEEHEQVFKAVRERPGHALRTYHELLVNEPAADFTGPIENNDERARIQDMLWDLRTDGYLTVEGRVWTPTRAQ